MMNYKDYDLLATAAVCSGAAAAAGILGLVLSAKASNLSRHSFLDATTANALLHGSSKTGNTK